METFGEILRNRRVKWSSASALVLLVLAVPFTRLGSNTNRATSNRAYIFRDQGTKLLSKGKAKEVILLTERREKNFPTDPYVYWYRGRAYYQLGEYDAALKAMVLADKLCRLGTSFIPPFHQENQSETRKRANRPCSEPKQVTGEYANA
jgi:hypothetical protein